MDAPIPRLVIRGLGSIGFPLSERDIGIIVAARGQLAPQDLAEEPASSLPPTRRVWEVPSKLGRHEYVVEETSTFCSGEDQFHA